MRSRSWRSLARPRQLATLTLLLAAWTASGCASQNQLVNGKREGPWTTYYQFGQKQESGNYLDGERTGTWRRWNVNGELQWVMNFEDGERHGPYSTFYNDGQPRERGQFEHGKKTGEWIRYFPGTKGAQRILYADGELVSREDLADAPAPPASAASPAK